MLQPAVPTRRRVSLHGSDLICRAGVIGLLRPRPEVLLLHDAETDQADVAVIIGDSVDEATLRSLRSLHCRGGTAMVLVVTHIDDAGLVAAVEHGVAGIVRRSDASPDHLVSVIRAAAAGEGSVPPDLLGRLLKQVGTVQRDVLSRQGLTFNGFTAREIEIMRLVADSYGTSEVAAALAYSERTIKRIIQDLTNRLHLRNRCHAVAYALRNGLI
ncbi:response regulator transcription factor [Micromonospora sp. NPDC093277]|uniref:response regulator transcription factor n=1 Tax=Micromonospora sp. NPDC093277 TaxID=3364291 RepID=UPI0037FCF465